VNAPIEMRWKFPVGLAWCLFTIMRIALAGFGIVLMWVGLTKSMELSRFTEIVLAHDLLPDSSVAVLTLLLVVLELLVGAFAFWAAMGSPRRCAIGSVAVTLLLLGFTGYALALSISPPPVPVPCGCTGTSAVVESWVPIMMRNAWVTADASCMVLGFLKFEGRRVHTSQGQGDSVLA